jgi:hypothetical protein
MICKPSKSRFVVNMAHAPARVRVLLSTSSNIPNPIPLRTISELQFTSNMTLLCPLLVLLTICIQGRWILQDYYANLPARLPNLLPTQQNYASPSPYCHQISSSSEPRSLGCLATSSIVCTCDDKSLTFETPTPSQCLKVLVPSCFGGSRCLTRAIGRG